MKIVSANKQQVQSLGRQALGTTGYEKDAELISTATQVVTGFANEQIDLMDKRQQQSASLFVQKGENNIMSQYGGRESFDVNELPAYAVTESMKLRGRIPSAEVLPLIYQTEMDMVVKEAGKMIDFGGSREVWQDGISATANKKLTQVQTAANASIENQIQKDQKFNYTNAVAVGDYETALNVVDGMFASDAEKKSFRENVYRKQEHDSYRSAISAGDEQGMADYSALLSQSNEDYQKAGGNLNAQEQLVAKHELDRELNRINNAKTAVGKAEKESLNYRIGLYRENAKNPGSTSAEETLALGRELEIMNSRTKGEYTQEIMEFNDSAALAGARDYMGMLPRADREVFIKQYKAKGLDDARMERLRNDLEVANENQTAVEKTDFMLSASQSGAFGPDGLVPLDLQMSPEMLVKNLGLRAAQYATAQQGYGRDLGQGILTLDEAKAFGVQINKMSSRDQMLIAQIINEGLGKKSLGFFQQVGKDGEARTLSMAGAAVNSGYMENAKLMLTGREFINNNLSDVKDIRKDIGDIFRRDIGNAYVNQGGKRSAVKDAFESAYIGLAKTDAEFSRINDDYVEQAWAVATGGLFEYNGQKIPVPEYGMPPKTMEKWFTGDRGISPEYIKNIGPPAGTTAEEFIKDLNNNEYRMEPGRRTGEFIVLRSIDGKWTPLADEKGGTWVLPYDSSANRWPPQGNPYSFGFNPY